MTVSSLDNTFRSLRAQSNQLRQVRAPQRQSTPNPLQMAATDTLPMFGEPDDIERSQNQYEHFQGRVYSAMRVVMQRIAGQPLMVARQTGKASKRSLSKAMRFGWIKADTVPGFIKASNPDDLEIIEQHILHDVFADPNELMTQSSLMNVTVANLLITGRSLWLMFEVDGKPQLLPIPTTWAKPVHGDMVFEAWEIKPPGSVGNGIRVESSNVAHFYFADPSDPFGCISPIQMIMRGILADESIATAQQVLFDNGGFPGMILQIGSDIPGETTPPNLTLAQRKQLMAWVRQEYQGVRKRGWPMILDAVIKDVKHLDRAPQEMGFLDSSNVTKGIIYEGLGVNPISAGQVEGANRASSAVADQHLVFNTVNPIIEMLSQVITAWVAPRFARGKERLRVWIANCEPHDTEYTQWKWDYLKSLHAVTQNEARQHLGGLPPLPDGDKIPVPMTMQFIPVGTEKSSRSRKSHNGTVRKQFLPAWLKVHKNAETRFAAEMQQFLDAQIAEVAKNLRRMDSKSRKDADSLAFNMFDPRQWDGRLRDAISAPLTGIMLTGASLQMESLSHLKDVWEDLISEFQIELPDEILLIIRRELEQLITAEFWEHINDTTKIRIVESIQAGIDEGENLTQMSDRLLQSFPDINRQRANLIARTETTGALNAGQHAVREELHREGITQGSEWLAVIDDDTRETHLLANGQIAKQGEMFDIGGIEAPYPGWMGLPVSERAHCRCVAVAVFDVDVVANSGVGAVQAEPAQAIAAEYGGRLRLNGHCPVHGVSGDHN